MRKPGDIIALPNPLYTEKMTQTAIWLAGNEYHRHQDTAIYIGDADEHTPEGYMIAAYPDGAMKVPLPDDEPEGWLWSDFPLLQVHRDLIVAEAVRQIGTPHSALDYFAIAAEKLGVPSGDHPRYLADESHMIGPQLVEHCYRAAGIRLFTDTRIDGYVTPMDVISIIEHPENIDYGR